MRVVLQEGFVEFDRLPSAAIQEVAKKHTIVGVDRSIIIHKLRDRLLYIDGAPLHTLLRDLQDAAIRHGVEDAVELT